MIEETMKKKMMFLSISMLLLFFGCIPLFPAGPDALNKSALETEEGILIPEETKSYDGLKSQLIIKSNLKASDVFLNGEFQGRTKLILNGLQPGRYNLRLRKNGFPEKEFSIEQKSGESHTYYIEIP